MLPMFQVCAVSGAGDPVKADLQLLIRHAAAALRLPVLHVVICDVIARLGPALVVFALLSLIRLFR